MHNLGMIQVARVIIRNPKRYHAAQEKDNQRRQNLVDAAFWNIISIIDESHDGKLSARTEVEALDILIRFGVFGASSKFPLRVSRHRKNDHHWNLSQAAPTEIPDEFKNWYQLVIEALRLSQTAGNITIESVDNRIVISTTSPRKKSPIQEELEYQYGQVVDIADTDHDHEYNPFDRLDARLLRSVGEDEIRAYK
jgi:hypothetical protein